MSSSHSSVPSIPGLISFAIRPFPLFPLQPILSACLRSILEKHPSIFERLGEHTEKRFGLDPTDLPFAFVLDPFPECASVKAVRELPDHLDAKISGPFVGLMGLADGSYDGDALFFSRDLVVEGDMEAVVALRNALDDAQIDFAEIAASHFGPMEKPASLFLHKSLSFFKGKKKKTHYHREESTWN